MRRNPERALQAEIVKYVNRFKYSDVLCFHVPNGGRRDIREAAQLKRMGTVPGVADLILGRNGSAFALELKSDNGRLSESQYIFRDLAERAGWFWAAAYGFEEALKILRAWELVK